jgi:hypothetical protein
VSGIALASATESDVTQLSPASVIVARDLYVKLTAAPGVAAERTFTLRIDGVNTALACTIVGSDTSCTSGASVSVPAGSELSIRVSSIGLPASASAMLGWRATSP